MATRKVTACRVVPIPPSSQTGRRFVPEWANYGEEAHDLGSSCPCNKARGFYFKEKEQPQRVAVVLLMMNESGSFCLSCVSDLLPIPQQAIRAHAGWVRQRVSFQYIFT